MRELKNTNKITKAEKEQPMLDLALFLLKVCLTPVYIIKHVRRKVCTIQKYLP